MHQEREILVCNSILSIHLCATFSTLFLFLLSFFQKVISNKSTFTWGELVAKGILQFVKAAPKVEIFKRSVVLLFNMFQMNWKASNRPSFGLYVLPRAHVLCIAGTLGYTQALSFYCPARVMSTWTLSNGKKSTFKNLLRTVKCILFWLNLNLWDNKDHWICELEIVWQKVFLWKICELSSLSNHRHVVIQLFQRQ